MIIETAYGNAEILEIPDIRRYSSETHYFGWHKDDAGTEYSIWVNRGQLVAIKND
jgi:hypothetical protein